MKLSTEKWGGAGPGMLGNGMKMIPESNHCRGWGTIHKVGFPPKLVKKIFLKLRENVKYVVSMLGSNV